METTEIVWLLYLWVIGMFAWVRQWPEYRLILTAELFWQMVVRGGLTIAGLQGISVFIDACLSR